MTVTVFPIGFGIEMHSIINMTLVSADNSLRIVLLSADTPAQPIRVSGEASFRMRPVLQCHYVR